MNLKICTVCKAQKSFQDFYKKGNGHDSYCRPCRLEYQKTLHEKNGEHRRAAARVGHFKNKEANNARSKAYYTANREKQRELKKAYYLQNKHLWRESHLKNLYGITREEYESMLTTQDGLCKICQKPPTCGKGKVLHLDHCHDSGKVRGLLCANCNVALGNFKDNPDIMKAAINYLIPFKQKENK